MTRKEQIELALKDLNEIPLDEYRPYFDYGFSRGVEWADKNPQKCEDHRHYCHCGECVWWSGQQGIKTGNVPDEK